MSQSPDNHYQGERVASIIKSFLEDFEYVPMDINPINKELEDYMEDVMKTQGVTCEQLKKTIHCSASLIELGCYKSTFEEKKNLALFNWYIIYIDDKISKNPTPFREFPSRLLRGQQQLDPILTLYTEVLLRMWDFYDPLAASAIFEDSISHIIASCIEPELKNLPLAQGVDRFPWYLRDSAGASIAFGLFPFTKSGNFNMLDVIQALPDMNFWICVSNDLLSFHKEESAGDTGTYIYNRARNENKSRYETCEEVVAELRKARQTIYLILAKIPDALERWKLWEHGYVGWHLAQERYRLKELGINL